MGKDFRGEMGNLRICKKNWTQAAGQFLLGNPEQMGLREDSSHQASA